MYFFRCGNFLGCKAGLSLLLVFFLPRPVFSCLRTGFFPPRTVFSRCLQNAFCAAGRCFFCCFEFFPLRSGIFCWRFFPLRKQLFPAAGRFFPAAKRVFLRSDVFFLLRTCVFRALREDKELENVESYTGRSPLVSWIAHGQIGDKGDQSLKQPSANEKLKCAALDAATCFNGSGYKRERQKEEEKAEERQQPQEKQQQQQPTTTTTTRTTTTTTATSTTTTSTITTITTTTTRSSMGSMDNMCSMRSMGSSTCHGTHTMTFLRAAPVTGQR